MGRALPPLPTNIVTHITLSKKTTSKPSLEFYSDGNGEVRRVTIENFPFRLGRAETADLRVESVAIAEAPPPASSRALGGLDEATVDDVIRSRDVCRER